MKFPYFAVSAAFVTVIATAGPAAARTHTIEPGETLTKIAAHEHVSLATLQRLNALEGTTGDRLVPGEKLRVTEDAPDPGAEPVDVASNPNATADLQMWGADAQSSAVRRFASGVIARTSSIAANLERNAMRFLGTPYVFGGTSPSGFDCSGYVQHVFAMMGMHLPRTADAQFYAAAPIRDQLSAGDLVFFQTYEPGPSHVGIYLGGGKFISASGHGVSISRMDNVYWAHRYLGAKRVLAMGGK